MPLGFRWDPTYWCFVGPAFLFMMYAQWRVKSAYNKWSQVENERRIKGLDAAEQLISQEGLSGISFNRVGGSLTDSYHPGTNTLNLSDGTAMRSSVASLAIVAHELGHAKQDYGGNFMMKLRSGIVPMVNIGAQIGPLLFFAGILLNFVGLMWLGIAFFSLSFFFALVTLPLEIDASAKAMRMLRSSGLLVGDRELRGARAVLQAAALTYVGALLMALLQLLYYISRATGRRR